MKALLPLTKAHRYPSAIRFIFSMLLPKTVIVVLKPDTVRRKAWNDRVDLLGFTPAAPAPLCEGAGCDEDEQEDSTSPRVLQSHV